MARITGETVNNLNLRYLLEQMRERMGEVNEGAVTELQPRPRTIMSSVPKPEPVTQVPPIAAPSKPPMPDAGGLIEALIGNRNVKGSKRLVEALVKADADMRAKGLRGLNITSDFRTRAQQEDIYARYLAGKVRVAAKPGMSRHEKGEAVDIANWQEAREFLRRYGLSNPIPRDEVHFQF